MKDEPQNGGRARPPGGPFHLPGVPTRVDLHHTPPLWVQSGEVYFLTACCSARSQNHLCQPTLGRALLDAAQHYHSRGDWHLRLMLLMPDHVHALLTPSPDKQLGRIFGDWKRFGSARYGVSWQKNFFEHRLRTTESYEAKSNYIRLNPVRAGLMRMEDAWPYVLENRCSI